MSDRSREQLQIGHSKLVANCPVLACDFRRSQRILRVHYLEHRGLPRGIPQTRESPALARRLHALVQRLELAPRSAGFGIELVQLRNQAALGCIERGVGSVAQNLGLANSMWGGKPIQHRDVKSRAGGVAEIPHSIPAIDSELHRIDAVGEVETEIGK